MSGPSWMLVRLALETGSYHAAADEDRLSLMDVKSRAEYRAFLARIYGFEAPVELALSRVSDLDPSRLRERFKSGRLRQDLLALGLSTHAIARLPLVRTIHIRTAAQALGWLFVIERPTLMAGIVRRHVQRVLGDELGGAISYLSAYGDTPGARFRELGIALDRQATASSPSAIISAACDAFRAQRQWYETYEQSYETANARRELVAS